MHKVLKNRLTGLILALMLAMAGGAGAETFTTTGASPTTCAGTVTLNPNGLVKCGGTTLLSSCTGDIVIDSTGTIRCSVTVVPSCTLTAAPSAIIGTGTSNLTASCSPQASSYVWSNSGCSATSATCTVTSSVTTTYTVKGVNGAGTGNSGSAVVTVTGSTSGVPVCAPSVFPSFGNTLQITANCSPAATSYSWSANTGLPNTVSGGNIATPSFTTTYSVAGQNASGSGVTASVTWTVSGSGQPAPTPTPSGPPVCALTAFPSFGNTLQLQANCSPAATSYTWSANTGFASTVSGGNVATPSVTTTYTVTGQNASGSDAPRDYTWTVDVATPNCTLTATPSAIAPGDTSVLKATCNPVASSYTWTGQGCTGNTTDTCTVTPTTTTSFTVQGQNVSGAGNSAPATVTISAPTCTLAATPSAIAPGNTSILKATCSPVASSYTWTGQGCVGNLTNTCTVTPAATTSYTVQGANSVGNGNTATASVTVSAPQCTLTATPASVTAGTSSTLKAACSPVATTYTWTGQGCVGNATDTCVVTPAATTAYSVQGSNSVGSGNTSPATVTVNIPGQCTANTNMPINFGTDFGKNFNIRMSRNESVSIQFTTPADSAGWQGNVVKEATLVGIAVQGFIHISASSCDFTYPVLTYKDWDGCGNSGLFYSLNYIVEATDSHTFGSCSLRPNTTYYVNIRNEDVTTPGQQGIDTCPVGSTCGFLFQMH